MRGKTLCNVIIELPKIAVKRRGINASFYFSYLPSELALLVIRDFYYVEISESPDCGEYSLFGYIYITRSWFVHWWV